MSDLFNIGISGLKTSRSQLNTTARNIANVNTPGYSRQRTEQSNQSTGYSGAGYVGSGVQADTTIRFYEVFLEQQIRDSNSQLSRFESYHDFSHQVDNILADPDTSLASGLNEFFNAVQQSNNYPASAAARSVLLTSADSLSDRFQLLHKQLSELDNQANTRLADISSEINTRPDSIARLNQKIASYRGNGSPNNLLDKREQLIKEVAERIEVSVEYEINGQGAANVFIGSGQPLVLANKGFAIGVSQGEYAGSEQEIMLYGGSGATAITEQVRGGEMQGVLDFKAEVLNPALNALGSIAAGLSAEFNNQHQLGMTLRESAPGRFNPGSDFFTDLSGPNPVLNSANNQGTATFNYRLTDTSVLTSSDYEMTFSSSAGTDTFTLQRLEDGVSFSGSGADPASALAALNNDLGNIPPNSINNAQGFSLSQASGTIQAGDKFLIQPTHDLASGMNVQVTDVLDIALANPLQLSQATNNLGVASNQGNAEMQLSDFNGALKNMPLSDALGNPVDIRFSYNGSGFDISSTANPSLPAGPLAYTAADSGRTFSLPGADYNHIQFTISGNPAVGDSFVLGNNNSPADDNRNGLQLAKLQNKKSMLNSSSDYQNAYAMMTAGVGTLTHSSALDISAQTTINEQNLSTRNSVSGVNLDEEAANLLKFQQSFAASAKVISAADEVFKTLLDATD